MLPALPSISKHLKPDPIRYKEDANRAEVLPELSFLVSIKDLRTESSNGTALVVQLAAIPIPGGLKLG